MKEGEIFPANGDVSVWRYPDRMLGESALEGEHGGVHRELLLDTEHLLGADVRECPRRPHSQRRCRLSPCPLPISHLPSEKQIGYYQWVPFILIAEALMFSLPCIFWRLMSFQSGLNIQHLINAACDTQVSPSLRLQYPL